MSPEGMVAAYWRCGVKTRERKNWDKRKKAESVPKRAEDSSDSLEKRSDEGRSGRGRARAGGTAGTVVSVGRAAGEGPRQVHLLCCVIFW
jgi:hypothetical protein